MLPVANTKSVPFSLVYDLYEPIEGLVLPAAYIVKRDKQGILTFLQQKAYPHTLEAYFIEPSAASDELFQWIEQLDQVVLEKKFSPPKKKQQTLVQLWEQPEVKSAILRFVHRHMHRVLVMLEREQLPVTWKIERKVLIKDALLTFGASQSLQPVPSFVKKDDGSILYRLDFQHAKGRFSAHDKEITPLVNEPAWVIMENKIHHLPDMNANMVKPFQKEAVVTIPPNFVKTYFQKFVLKQAGRLDIKAEGFEVTEVLHLDKPRLELPEVEFSFQSGLNLYLPYGKFEFLWFDKRRKHTMLDMSKTDQIDIISIQRNDKQEEKIFKLLPQLGLHVKQQQYWAPNGISSVPALIEWLQEEHKTLEKAGFEVTVPTFDSKPILMKQPTIEQQIDTHNDWFDIKITIHVEEYVIPFLKLVPYILSGNPYFPINDQSYFLIPEEWLEKYKNLAQFGKKESEGLRLTKSQFTLVEELQPLSGIQVSVPVVPLVGSHPVPATLQATLRPYQLEGFHWLLWNYDQGLGACLADDMGLGKTLQTITMLLHAKAHKAVDTYTNPAAVGQLDMFSIQSDLDFIQPLNALIILPASLVFNWKAELQKFAPSLNVYVHTGAKRNTDPRLIVRYDVVLTTYHTALRDVGLLEKLGFEYIVLDESQQIKNIESKVFKAINRLNGKHKISLSGTPIENALSDLWAQMQFINPGLLGTFTSFKKNFVGPIERHNNEERKTLLRKLVQPYLLRRTKEEVAKDLPDLEIQVFYCEMTLEQKKLYDREKSAARNLLLDNFEGSNFAYRSKVLESLTRLRQIVNHPVLVDPEYTKGSGKYNDVLELWQTVVRSDHKALMFSSFVGYLDQFKGHFEGQKVDFSWLTGSSTAKEREANVLRFQEQEQVKTFLISTKAGGVGLNLTAADYVFILDPWWNPAVEKQAIARAHRIGQQKNVFAIKFITKDSIEEKILKLQEKKSVLADDILGIESPNFMNKEELSFLLE